MIGRDELTFPNKPIVPFKVTYTMTNGILWTKYCSNDFDLRLRGGHMVRVPPQLVQTVTVIVPADIMRQLYGRRTT